jgi:hypothetical protein
VPRFEQSHFPRFAVLQDRRCGAVFARGAGGLPSLAKNASTRALSVRQRLCNVGFTATFRTLQNPDSSHWHSLTGKILFYRRVEVLTP